MSNKYLACNKTNKLGTEKVSKLILSFFSTSLVGLVLNSIYNLTDTLFISWGVGDYAMGGVSIIAPFMFLQGAISTMIGGGAATLISLKLGKGKADEAGKITVNAMVIFYTISIIITALGLIFINPLLRVMGASEEIFSYAKDYFMIMLIGNVFSTGFSAIMRAEGKNLYSMITWMSTIIINIVLDAIFVFVLKWGVKGAAAATVIGQFCGVMLSVFFFAKVSGQKFKGSKIEFKTIGEILKIGVPSLAQMGSFSIIVAMFNIILNKYSGAMGIITFGYISKLLMFAIAPFTAIAHSLAPVVGFNYGNGNNDRVKQSLVFSLKIAFIYALLILILVECLPNYLLMIFTKDSAIIQQGAVGLRILAIALIFLPLPIIIGAKMQAVGNKLWALILFSSNAAFIILPAIFLGKTFGLNGLMWAFIIANSLSNVLVIGKWLFKKLWLKKNVSIS